MCEEEIIKILKDTISLFNSDTHCFIYSENERVEAIQGLLDLYQKEEKIKLKSKIEKNILNKLEDLTRYCYTYDIDKIKKLSETYKNIKGE